MKSKNIMMAVFAALLFAIPSASAAVTDKTPVAQDFTFGLSDKFPAVKPYEEGETGAAMWERFLQIRQELPEELPIFKPYEPFGEQKIYVSKDGSDANKGTIDKPVKTIERAMEIASSGPIGEGKVIYIREGIYDVSSGLNIPAGLSGTEKNPSFISAYPGEDVVLSGGISVKGSEFKVADDDTAMRKLPDKAKGKVYSVNLYDLGYTGIPQAKNASLSVDGTEYTIARWPNATSVAMGEVKGAKSGVYDIGPVTHSGFGNAITGDTGAGFEFKFIDPRPLSWENNDDIWLYGAFAVEYTRGYKRVRSINEEKMSIRTYDHEALGATYDSHNSYYYLNILEELDIPGEWYFDKASGMLYLWPISDLEDSEVSISKSSSDLVTFDKSSEYIVLNDVKVSTTGGKGITVKGYRNLVQNCVIEGVGSSGVYITDAKNCGVINSDVYGSGITIWGSSNRDTSTNADCQSLRPTRNFVQNNCIYNASTAIMVRYGVQHIVSHNSIMNADGMTIYVAETQESIIEYNEAVGSPWKTRDGGTVYLEGGYNNLYNHIRYNYFHHTTLQLRPWPFMIYLDDLTSNTFVYGNIMQMGYMYIHGGSWNVAYNNVAIDCPAANSVTNCDQYVTGGQHVMNDRIIKVNGSHTGWNSYTSMKINHEKIKRRYPTIHHFMSELQQLRINRLIDPDCVNNEFEIEMKEPQGCVYKNNIAYNTQNARIMYVETREMFENNYKFESSDIFEDYENRNYNIKPDSEVYDKIDDFEDMPPIEKIGIIDLKEDMEQNTMYPLNPANDPDVKAFPTKILFKWTPSYPATFYTFELATDENFENIIETGRVQEPFYQSEKELELDTVYYWRVKADSYAGHVKNPEIIMETASFKTYTYDEAAANTSLNTAVYESEYERMKQYTDGIFEDDGVDHGVQPFTKGTKDQLYTLLEASAKRVKGYALQSEVDGEIDTLNDSFTKILLDNAVKDYVRTYSADDISMWHINKDVGTVKAENGVVSIKAIKDGGAATATDQRILAPGEKVRLRIKLPLKMYEGIGIKQISSGLSGGFYGNEGYYIVPTPTAIELQRYPANGGDVIASVKNDGLMTPDGWHDLEFSCTPEGDYQRIVISIDGKEVINHLDDFDPNNKMGYVSIQGRFEPTQLK